MPEAKLTGRFAIYDTPDGGFHIAYIPDGSKDTQHLEIPAMLVRMGRLAAEGKLNPMQALKGLMNGA